MFIDGTWTDGRSSETIRVVSPATGETLADVPSATGADVEAAVAAARQGQVALEALGVYERAELLHAAAALIEGDAEAIARDLAIEQGKPWRTEALEEVHETAGNFRMAAEDVKRLDTHVIPSEQRGKMIFTLRKPNGVFAVITPWNFPIMIPSELIAPALATGNAVILKPSEFTPLAGRRLVEVLHEAGFPPGSVNLLFGGRGVGEALVTHPGVDAIAFVGSHTTGEAIVRSAGLKRTLIEASGNGPLIVLGDADIDAAAAAAVEGAAYLAGQVCVATERVLVARERHDEFLERVLHHSQAVVLGDPLDEATTMGPLNNEPVAQKMDEHVADALERGASVVSGGSRASGFATALYWEPTVMTDVPADAKVAVDETFGPIAPIVKIGSLEDAIESANASPYGLLAAIFTKDLAKGLKYADEARTGLVNINETTNYWENHLPFGGRAGTASGVGRVGGRYAMDTLTELQTVVIG